MPAVLDQPRLIVSMDVYPHGNINFMLQLFHEIGIGISEILISDQSRRSLTIKQNLRTLPDMVIGMVSQVSQ